MITPAEKERIQLSQAALKRVGRLWPGAVALTGLKDSNPGLNAYLEAVQARLDEVWQAARMDMMTMPEFKTALQAWEAAHFEAIEEFNKGKK